MIEPSLEIKNLDFFYDKTPVLQSVSLSISNGEFVGIFGPNGGGKTTLLQLIMGFLKPSKGEILLFGESPKAARIRVGYVPQAALYDRQFPLSVLELVLMGCLSKASFWGTFSSEVKEKAQKALDQVGLLDKQSASFGTLSGGQAQRALIARALVSSPDLLLLDEPTASVDTDAEAYIHQLLINMRGQMTILMVTHDLQAISQKVDRWLCVNTQVTSYQPKEVCEHFGLGLYHSPLLKRPT